MASDRTLHLVIASVDETLFDGDAVSVTVPGSAGECTILPSHEPLVTTLRRGTITARFSGNEPRTFDVTDGVLECSGHSVTVLL